MAARRCRRSLALPWAGQYVQDDGERLVFTEAGLGVHVKHAPQFGRCGLQLVVVERFHLPSQLSCFRIDAVSRAIRSACLRRLTVLTMRALPRSPPGSSSMCQTFQVRPLPLAENTADGSIRNTQNVGVETIFFLSCPPQSVHSSGWSGCRFRTG